MGLTARLSVIALVCALATPLSSGQQASDVGNRIILGEEAIPGEFPFMAALEKLNQTTDEWEFNCGGSIIGERHILTAAHCVENRDLKNNRVQLGCHKLSECNNVYGVSQIVAHPLYHERFNDIAILKLDRSIEFNQTGHSGSISEIRPNEELLEDEHWGNLTVIGWGGTESGEGSDVLMKVDIKAISFAECKDIYTIFIGDDAMCAGGNGRSFCFGDSGGPLFKTYHGGAHGGQIGVVSGLYKCGSDGIFARVASHYSWIMRHTKS